MTGYPVRICASRKRLSDRVLLEQADKLEKYYEKKRAAMFSDNEVWGSKDINLRDEYLFEFVISGNSVIAGNRI